MFKTLILASSVLALGATGALAGGMKNKSAQGMYHPHHINQQGQAIMPPKNFDRMQGMGGSYIVDEYGRHYNERGDRIR